MGLYERIRDVAKEKGYSINKLEKELGFARSSINKFNKNTPSADKLQQIADFLGVPLDFLMPSKKKNAYVLTITMAQVMDAITKSRMQESEKELEALFDELQSDETFQEENALIESFRNDAQFKGLVRVYNGLNDIGRKKLLDNAADLSMIYSSAPELKAAHERTDIEVTAEMKAHDGDIMNDPDF